MHQYSWRLRLQNHVRPGLERLASDSAFIQANISTAPSRGVLDDGPDEAVAVVGDRLELRRGVGDRGGGVGGRGPGGVVTVAPWSAGSGRWTVSVGRSGSEVEAGAAVEAGGGHGVDVPLPQDHVLLALDLDLEAVLRVEQDVVARP